MTKLLLIFSLLPAVFSHAQSKGNFPYAGGLINLEKDINTIFVEASDSGRIYFVEITYIKKGKKLVPIVHGATEDATKDLIILFFEKNIDKWDKRYVKKTSVLIPLFIEGIDFLKLSVLNSTNLSIQASRISASFEMKKCLITKPYLITKSEFSFDLDK